MGDVYFAAVLMTIIGLLLGVIITHKLGLRLGGVITVPLIALYSLRDIRIVLVFFLGTVLTYLALEILYTFTYIYGRDEVFAAVFFSIFTPLGAPLVISFTTGTAIPDFLFVTGILSGLAAYNLQQLSIRNQILDSIASIFVWLFLVVFGTILLDVTVSTPGLLTGEFFSQFNGLYPDLLTGNTFEHSRTEFFIVILVSMIISEIFRRRYKLRLGLVAILLG